MDAPDLQGFLDRRVVLDTQGPLLYIGRLVAWDRRGYWLEQADMHDCHDGHASKEEYVNEAYKLEREGSRHVNRRRVFVARHAIVSVSALDDVVTDGTEEQGAWVP